jgi:hypothetical protein
VNLACCDGMVCNTGWCNATSRVCESTARSGDLGQPCDPANEATCTFGGSRCEPSTSGGYRCAACGRQSETCCPVDFGNCSGSLACDPGSTTCRPWNPQQSAKKAPAEQ